MKLLLDTHAFLWWDSDPSKLSPPALSACQDPGNTLLFSVASAWEIQIKVQLTKLKLNVPLADVIAAQQQTNRILVLPISLDHVIALEHLPVLHKDPFDRLLVAQARVEGAALVSGDGQLKAYSVTHLW